MSEADMLVKILLESGISFSQGTYTKGKYLTDAGFKTDGLFVHRVYPPKSSKSVRYTVNDTSIPTPLLYREGDEWCYDPRSNVTELQDSVKAIYKENRIEGLIKEIELVKEGKKNVLEIINAIAEEKIKIPAKYSVDGVKTLVEKEQIFVSSFNLGNRLTILQKEKEFLDRNLKPEDIDEIISYDATKLADEWRYRMPKLNLLKV